jgi:hypothetical protein
MKRRNFLKGAASLAASSPLFSVIPSSALGACPNGPRRIIVMSYPMGIIRPLWQPQGTATNFSLPYCTAPLEGLKDRCLFVSNVDNKVLGLRSEFFWGHAQKKESALTGSLLTSAFSGAGRNHVEDIVVPQDQNGGAKSASIDTIVGQSFSGPYARGSVDLGVVGDNSGDRVNSAFHWQGEANPASMITNPQTALNEYFSGLVQSINPNAAVVAQNNRQASVLDAIRAQFRELRAGLDYRDRQRLDLHADYIRQLEIDIQPTQICQQPQNVPNGSNWQSQASMLEAASIQVRLLAQAMACNVAPVGRLEFLHQQNPYFGLPAIDDPIAQGRTALSGDWGWHGLCHTNSSQNDPATGSPSRPHLSSTSGPITEDMFSPHLRDGMRFYVQVFADLLQELDRFVEDTNGRTVLDNSLCVLVTDMGDGHGHAPLKSGYILAGNLGPFRTGYHFDAAQSAGGTWSQDSDYDHTHVLTTIAQAFCLQDQSGAPLDYFGIEGFSSSGALPVRTT